MTFVDGRIQDSGPAAGSTLITLAAPRIPRGSPAVTTKRSSGLCANPWSQAMEQARAMSWSNTEELSAPCKDPCNDVQRFKGDDMPLFSNGTKILVNV